MKKLRMSNGRDRKKHLLVRTIVLALFPCICFAQSLQDCKTVFIQPMPESMDRFVSAELVKWGVIKVTTVEEKADCVASFGRQASKVEVKSSGSAVVPTETSVKAEGGSQELPSDGWGGKAGALEFVHRGSSVVVWADSKRDEPFMGTGRPRVLARKLVDQLKKDYKKKK